MRDGSDPDDGFYFEKRDFNIVSKFDSSAVRLREAPLHPPPPLCLNVSEVYAEKAI